MTWRSCLQKWRYWRKVIGLQLLGDGFRQRLPVLLPATLVDGIGPDHRLALRELHIGRATVLRAATEANQTAREPGPGGLLHVDRRRHQHQRRALGLVDHGDGYLLVDHRRRQECLEVVSGRGDEEGRALLCGCALLAKHTHEKRRRGNFDRVERMRLAIRGNRRLDAFRGRLSLVVVEAARAGEKPLHPREEQVPRRGAGLRGRPCRAGRIAMTVDGVVSAG